MNEEEVMRVLGDMVVRLTDIRWKGCNHLSVENFSPELFSSLVEVAKHHDLLPNDSPEVVRKSLVSKGLRI